MTPEECGRLVRSMMEGDVDNELLAKANAEATAQHEELLRTDPIYKARWGASIKEFADRSNADDARIGDEVSDEKRVCVACKGEIDGRVAWMCEHSERSGPYSMHPKCADAPWPLYEITETEALALIREGKWRLDD